MKNFALALTLGVSGFAVLYVSLIAGEALAMTSPIMTWRASTQISLTLLAAMIYLLITAPTSYGLARGMIHWFPNVGRSAIGIAAFLITTTVIVLQLAVYADSVVGRSILKVVFCVAPLSIVLLQSRRNPAQ